ncbi:MAG: paraslipin [Symploca sp. SIO1A3]|nr:paraslipin [Symploca sp. SIO2C1]NER51636.1 paraslipin [Symploca sp. SIO1A3]
MDIISIIAPMILVIFGYSIGSTRIITQGNQALVERLGQYKRKLDPGLNFIIPFVDRIAVEETTRERVLDIAPQPAITKDNVSVEVNAVVYWRVLDLERAYYEVEDVEDAIGNLVITTLRSAIGHQELDETYSSREEINKTLLNELDKATVSWGVKVLRVEVQDITLPKSIMESLEKERAAESEKQAAIFKAEGEKQASISRAEGTVQSIEMIAQALQGQSNSQAVLQYLVAQRFVDANQKLGESENSKIIFMNPGDLSEAVVDLMQQETGPRDKVIGNGSN